MNNFPLTGSVSNTGYPVSWQFKCCWSPYQPHRQSFFLNEWCGNFEFELCNNIENKFNGGMPCIAPYVSLHAFLRRSEVLTFNPVMHNVPKWSDTL